MEPNLRLGDEICDCGMFGCKTCFKQQGWDMIFGGGEVFPQKGMAPPCSHAEWEEFSKAAAQR